MVPKGILRLERVVILVWVAIVIWAGCQQGGNRRYKRWCAKSAARSPTFPAHSRAIPEIVPLTPPVAYLHNRGCVFQESPALGIEVRPPVALKNAPVLQSSL